MDSFRILSFRYAPLRLMQALLALPFMGLLLALFGPFGSYTTMGFWERCAHFSFCFTLVGFLIIEGGYRIARRFFAGNWPLWMALLYDLVLVVPAALIVWGSLHIFGKAALPFVRFTDLIWQNLVIILMVQPASRWGVAAS